MSNDIEGGGRAAEWADVCVPAQTELIAAREDEMRGSGDFDFIPAENKKLLAPSSTAGPSPFPRGGRGTGLKAYTRSSGLAPFRLPCVKGAVAKRLRDCTFSLGLPYCTVWGLRFSASPKSLPTSRGLRAFKLPFRPAQEGRAHVNVRSICVPPFRAADARRNLYDIASQQISAPLSRKSLLKVRKKEQGTRRKKRAPLVHYTEKS